ncbi:MAG: molybdate ABC transporter substrate-binding protein [Alphaproteobacteria bacterium]|nr:molybdate ABC transporter substrate-binding protein [Alphaproteobacteria bacterium]
MRRLRLVVCAVLATLAGLAGAAAAVAQEKPVRVYAASSLTDALNQIGDLYAKHGHPRPVIVYAASSTLARQIEQGAPADVFISADEAWMDYLETRKLIDPATRASTLANQLALVAPADRPFALAIGKDMDLKGALKGGKLAMGDPDSVPAGKYGKAALETLGIWPGIASSVVRAENVRAALLFVERGEAAAGVVYLTDRIIAKDKVALVGVFPAESHPPISYPSAAVSGGDRPAASSFLAFLDSPEARAVFTRLGFRIQPS